MGTKMINVVTLSATGDNDGELKGVANSLTKTRNGITITEDAVSGLEGKKVPLLANHNWSGQPIGAAVMGKVDEEGLHYTARLFDNAPDRDLILEAIKNGVESVSIGFRVLDYDKQTVTKLDLLELSVTPVPADAKANVEVLDMNDNEKKQQNNNDDTKKQNEKPSDSGSSTLDDAVSAVKDGFNKLADAISALGKDDASNSDDDDSEDVTEELKQSLATVFALHPDSFTYEEYRKVKKLLNK